MQYCCYLFQEAYNKLQKLFKYIETKEIEVIIISLGLSTKRKDITNITNIIEVVI